MKLLIGVLAVFLTWPLIAEESKESSVIQKAESQNAFKGLFYKVWNKFKLINPKNESRINKRSTVTAGIRGAESTTTLLEPYWKGDKLNNKRFIQQLESFSQAQTLADQGNLQAAQKAFEEFTEQWPKSDLKSNAQFASAMIQGAMGKLEESQQGFDEFIRLYPGHPLVEDAKLLLSDMK